MTKNNYQQWLADPQLALAGLLKDLQQNPSFDADQLEEAFVEATGHVTKGQQEHFINQQVATWAYQTDHEDLFLEALAWHFSSYPNYIQPIYSCSVTTGDRQFEEANLYLSRTQNKMVIIVETDWVQSSGGNYKIDFHDPKTFDVDKVIDDFITMVEDYGAYNSGCDLITEDVETYEEEGRIGGTVSYNCYLDWIVASEDKYILN